MKAAGTYLLCVLIVLLPGCEVFASPQATKKATSEIVLELTRDLVGMVQQGIITPEQFERLNAALQKAQAAVDAKAETTGYEFDWTPLVVTGTSILTSITGVQIIRNRARRQRGEPVGNGPPSP